MSDASDTEKPQSAYLQETPMTPHEEALVRALGRVMQVLPRLLDTELRQEQNLPLSEYSAMMNLSAAPNRAMRMSELATASLLSLSGMTRVIARLESAGLVERIRCGDDARGWSAVLTEAGLDRLHRSWPTHLAGVRRHVLDHLGDADVARLTTLLQRIAT